MSLEAAPLRETLSAVLAAPVARRVLALGKVGGDWLPAGFDLMGQRGGDYGERTAAAFADAHATTALPVLLIRAGALEVAPDMLEDAARSLISGEADAAFGPTGHWSSVSRRPVRAPTPGGCCSTGSPRRGCAWHSRRAWRSPGRRSAS